MPTLTSASKLAVTSRQFLKPGVALLPIGKVYDCPATFLYSSVVIVDLGLVDVPPAVGIKTIIFAGENFLSFRKVVPAGKGFGTLSKPKLVSVNPVVPRAPNALPETFVVTKDV